MELLCRRSVYELLRGHSIILKNVTTKSRGHLAQQIRVRSIVFCPVPRAAEWASAHEQRFLRNIGVHTVMLDRLEIPYDGR